MAEKKLMEKVVRKVLHSFPKVNMPDPFVPYPIAYPPAAKSRGGFFFDVAERGEGARGAGGLCWGGPARCGATWTVPVLIGCGMLHVFFFGGWQIYF